LTSTWWKSETQRKLVVTTRVWPSGPPPKGEVGASNTTGKNNMSSSSLHFPNAQQAQISELALIYS